MADLMSLARSGRVAETVHYEILRELVPDDLTSLAPVDKSTPLIKQIRYSHHQAAKMVADGMSGIEISAVTGYSGSRISILKNDPSFQELVAFYHEQALAQYGDIHKRLAAFGFSCLEEAQERLEANPENFSLKELREWMNTVLDRSVAPSKVTSPAMGAGGPGSGVSLVVNFVRPDPAPGPILEHTPREAEVLPSDKRS